MTDYALRDRVVQSLAPGEAIVWRQKAAWAELALGKAFAVVFSLVWSGFAWGMASLAIYSIWFAPRADANAVAAPWPALLIAGMMSAFGLIFVWATMTDFIASWSTHYALTDRRLMIVSRFATESFDGDAFGMCSVMGGPRVGAIAFAWGPIGRRSAGYTSSLVGVHSPHDVLALIKRTLRRTAAR